MVCGYQYRSEFVGFLEFKNVALLNRVVWHQGNCLAKVDVERICSSWCGVRWSMMKNKQQQQPTVPLLLKNNYGGYFYYEIIIIYFKVNFLNF